jgi:hypothetical protein
MDGFLNVLTTGQDIFNEKIKNVVTDMAQQKIAEIKNELKASGLWKKEMPVWVMNFTGTGIRSENEFIDWLQFIYLPNCTAVSSFSKRSYIVPQALRFFSTDVKKGKLLQLLIELDSLL